jgi:tRNA pseudouridine38-40 synthase
MSYRGTDYHGFQRQNNAVTVQETVERCVGKVLNEKSEIFGCSRTDAGVHANRYCFSVYTNSSIATRNFVRGVNGELPKDISILSCEEAPSSFHARYSCTAKEYVYLIHNSESHNPFAQDLMLHYRRKFNAELVREAAYHFTGTHDFKSFCGANSQKIVTVRTICEFYVEVNGDRIKLLVKADGFLYNMIRIMVGTLLGVNEGQFSPSDIPLIIAAKDRTKAGRTAPAHGLYLNRISYSDRQT